MMAAGTLCGAGQGVCNPADLMLNASMHNASRQAGTINHAGICMTSEPTCSQAFSMIVIMKLTTL